MNIKKKIYHTHPKIISINELNLINKTVLIRVDFNVPMKNQQILSDNRIQASLPTIKFALQKQAKIIIMSHLGRPEEGKYNPKFSLLPIVKYLKKIFYNYNIIFSKKIKNVNLKPQEILILENVRFNIGEKNNNINLSKKYASLCDIFVMDAFGCAHRKEASTVGVGKFSKIACAGLLFSSEIYNLQKVLKKPNRPLTAIIGGSKISTKFKLIESLSQISNNIIVGGGIANTFLAINNNIGKSLYEPKYIKLAQKIKQKNNIIIPVDCRVGTSFSKHTISKTKKVNEIDDNEQIMDIGNISIKIIKQIIQKSKTIIWNGPLGVFEFPSFCIGTKKIAYSISKSKAFSIAGGGETISIINQLNIMNKISYISTGGGSFLQFIEKKKLPTIKMLEKSKIKNT